MKVRIKVVDYYGNAYYFEAEQINEARELVVKLEIETNRRWTLVRYIE